MALKRIQLQIRLPSVGLKQFIERALKDDDFFRMAIENPRGAFAAVGLSLAETDFLPADFAAFFGVLGRLRGAIEKDELKEATFESIFGAPPVYYGATFKAQIELGFQRDWGGQQASTDRQGCFSTTKSFAQDAGTGRGIGASQDTCESRSINAEISVVGLTEYHAYSTHHTERNWNNVREIATTKEYGINRAQTEDFGKDGKELDPGAQFLRGPLIHPTDLAAVAARLEAFTAIAGVDKS